MTIREWKTHKAEQERDGVCDHCPFRRECDALQSDADVQAFADGAVRSFILGLALAMAALAPEARA